MNDLTKAIILQEYNGKRIKDIRIEYGYDARWDDVIITFEDNTNITIMGEFELQTDTKNELPAYSNYTNYKDPTEMPIHRG